MNTPIPDERHRELRERLGAYVLDQLDDDERAEVDEHLDGCPDCRAEVENLLPLAGPLAAVDPDSVEPGSADPGSVDPGSADPAAATPGDPVPADTLGFAAILDRIRAEDAGISEHPGNSEDAGEPANTPPRPALDPPTIRARPALDPPTVVTSAVAPLPAVSGTPTHPAGAPDRRSGERDGTVRPLRRRPQPSTLRLAAAAAVIALLGIGLGTVLAPGPAAGPVESVGVQALRPGIDASAGVVPHSWGVEVTLTATGFADGQTYRAAVLDAAGRPVGAGEFVGTGANEMRCHLNSSVLRDRATGFVVTDAAGNPVLTSRFAA